MHSGQPRKVKALTKARYVNTFCGLLCDDAGSHVTVLQTRYGSSLWILRNIRIPIRAGGELPREALEGIERDRSQDRAPRYPAFLRLDNGNTCGLHLRLA
ncbi:unnamed protein product [Lasius platythorax]|uniref:Uncharacterized protein n=1 Tax=Lasius platythorax TaxID=488582 RepID=A0AAV2PB00_9HYME